MAIGVGDIQVKFKLDKRVLTLDFLKVPFPAWAELKGAIGLTQKTLFGALAEMDTEAQAALVWLERAQRERKLRYSRVWQELSNSDINHKIDLLKVTVDGQVTVDNEDDEEIAESVDGDDNGDPTLGS